MSEEKVQKCERCDEPLVSVDYEDRDGYPLCGDCYRDARRSCEVCGSEDWKTEFTRVNGDYWCSGCYEDSFICDHCDRRYTSVEYCGDGLCSDCYRSSRDDDELQDYSSKPPLTPLGDGPPWFGVELEMMPKVALGDAIEWLQESKFHGERFILKKDGTVGGGGELCTSPMSVPLHRVTWQNLFDDGFARNWKAWKQEECGMHIHITRKPVAGIAEKKIVALINSEDNHELINQLAGRQPNDFCFRDSSRLFRFAPPDHYAVVSASTSNPEETLEIRAFKASINIKRIMCCIEFCAVLSKWVSLRGCGLLKAIRMPEIERFAASMRQAYPAYAGFVMWGREFFRRDSFTLTSACSVDPKEARALLAKSVRGKESIEA